MNLNVTAALIATVGAAWPSPPCIKGAAAHLKARRGLSGKIRTCVAKVKEWILQILCSFMSWPIT